MVDDITVTINNLYIFTPNLLPSVETHLMSNEATQKNYKISYDDYYREGRIISDMIFQVDIRSAPQVSTSKYLICAHETQNRINVPHKNNNFAVLDNLDLRKYYAEMDGQ